MDGSNVSFHMQDQTCVMNYEVSVALKVPITHHVVISYHKYK
jgi:hypothetical protein